MRKCRERVQRESPATPDERAPGEMQVEAR